MSWLIWWESECGHKGHIDTTMESLAHLVREALLCHSRRYPQCHDADIIRVETLTELQRRINFDRRRADGS